MDILILNTVVSWWQHFLVFNQSWARVNSTRAGHALIQPELGSGHALIQPELGKRYSTRAGHALIQPEPGMR